MANFANVTIPAGSVSIATLGGSGGSGYSQGNYNYTYSTTGSWNTASSVIVGTQPSLQVNGDADIKGQLKVNGQDIVKILDQISRRLCILVPDPARLDKYEALQQAYDHYKTLEALCWDEPPAEK